MNRFGLPIMNKKDTMAKTWIALGVLTVALTGCDVGNKTDELTTVAPYNPPAHQPAAAAGIGAAVVATPGNDALQLAKTKFFRTRRDAFALLPTEAKFERAQTSFRLLNDGGGFATMFTEPEMKEEAAPVVEPLPAWRLTGVIIGNGVVALLDMGNEVIDIRPGMKIPNSDWTVVSIDADRAVLRRPAGKLPTVFVVPLQGAPPKNLPAAGGNQGGTGGGTGGNNGGPPSGPSRGNPAGGGGTSVGGS